MSPFTDSPSASIASLGELKLISAIRKWRGPATPSTPFGIGDDCAVLAASSRRQLVTVDPVIYGKHFDDSVSPRAVGEKLLKRNLSDIAAMGGRPRAAVVALALDDKTSIRWLAAFHRGLASASRRYGTPIIGGDISHQPGGVAATLTLIGEASSERVLTRHGAKIGYWIYVTGTLGGSLRGHHHRFTPRLAEGRWLAARPEVRSMMDLSDGLAKDLPALAPNRAEPALDPAAIPISPAARQLARTSGHDALHHALCDGEDYELVFTVASKTDLSAFARAWKRRFPDVRLTCLGRFARTISANHVNLRSFHGYEHLR